MNSLKRLIIVGLAAFCLGFATGCVSGPKEVATRIEYKGEAGKSLIIELPKNHTAADLDVGFDPVTKTFHFKAGKLQSDASGVLQVAATAQAEASGKIADAAKAIAGLVAPAAIPIPLAPAPAPAAEAAAK